METLDAGQAAALLHLNIKQVQKMAREGRLPAVRIGRRWLFPREKRERAVGMAAPTPAGAPGFGLSARNNLRGTIAALAVDGLMAEGRGPGGAGGPGPGRTLS